MTQDGTVRDFDAGNFSLLSPFICDAIGTKEDRRAKRVAAGLSSSSAPPGSSSFSSAPTAGAEGGGAGAMVVGSAVEDGHTPVAEGEAAPWQSSHPRPRPHPLPSPSSLALA